MIEEILKKLKKDCHIKLKKEELDLLYDVINSHFPELEELVIDISKKCTYDKEYEVIDVPLINKNNDDITLKFYDWYEEQALFVENKEKSFYLSLIKKVSKKTIFDNPIILRELIYQGDNYYVKLKNLVPDWSYLYGLLEVYEGNDILKESEPYYTCKIDEFVRPDGSGIRIMDQTRSKYIYFDKDFHTTSDYYKYISNLTIKEYEKEKNVLKLTNK